MCNSREAVPLPANVLQAALTQASAEQLQAALRQKCQHRNEVLRQEGASGLFGTVTCQDCGRERDWGAY